MNQAIKKAIENHQKGLIDIAKKQYLNIIDDGGDGEGIAAHYLAAIYQKEGNFHKSKELYELSLIRTKDKSIRAMFLTNYGALLRKIGSLEESLKCYTEAYEINPNIAELNTNIATLLWSKGDQENALTYAEKSLNIKETCEAHLVFARDYKVKRNYEKAEKHAIKACDLKPDNIEALCLLAGIYTDANDFQRADKYFAQAKKKIPAGIFDYSYETYYYAHISTSKNINEIKKYARDNFKYINKLPLSIISLIIADLKKYLCWEEYDDYLDFFINESSSDSKSSLTFGNVLYSLSMHLPIGTQRKIAESIAKDRFSRIERKNHTNKITGKPKIGLLSSDFRSHAVGYLTASLFEAFSTDKFEYIVYSNYPETESTERTRIRNAFGRWKNIFSLNDDQAFELIVDDEIDILIEFNGCTSGERLTLLAKKPAPIQITYLGMPGSTGADFIDYVIGDKIVLSEECQIEFTEKPLILECCYQPNDKNNNLNINVKKSQFGLPEDKVIICSFNQTYKLDKDTFDDWMHIVSKSKNSILWMIIDSDEAKNNLLSYCKSSGIDEKLIVFADRIDHDLHISRLKLADFAVDSFPYNAHTTASDCLRAGIPIISRKGKTFAGKVTESLLNELDLKNELLASDRDNFREIGLRLATDSRYLTDIKNRILVRYPKSTLVDNSILAKNIESLFDKAILNFNSEIDFLLINKGQPIGEVAEIGFPNQPFINKTKFESNINFAAEDQLVSIDAEVKLPWIERLKKEDLTTKLHNLEILAEHVLQLQTELLCADVGALPDAPKIWDALAHKKLVKVIGFEPQFSASSTNGCSTVFDLALGDGLTHTLHIAKDNGMTSLLEADYDWLSHFPMFSDWGRLERKVELKTICADDVPQIAQAQFIKIDTQGSEKFILENAQHLMDDSLVLIELELSPVPLYKNEPTMFEVGIWLESRGWMLHNLSNLNRRMLKPLGKDSNPHEGMNHIFQVDAVFLPHIDRWPTFKPDRLLALAFLAHAFYGSFDIAALALKVHDSKAKVVPRYADYLRFLNKTGLHA
jgi:protein O-GlcNAc transferase